MNTESIIESIAFESKSPDRGFTLKASYLKPPRDSDALVEVLRDGKPLRAFFFPAYKIWNIAAHFSDIVDGEIAGDSHGYEMAAWDGISNAIVLIPKEDESADRATFNEFDRGDTCAP